MDFKKMAKNSKIAGKRHKTTAPGLFSGACSRRRGNMKINILGKQYELKRCKLPSDRDGDCNRYEREIRVRPVDELLPDGTDKGREEYEKQVIRHELVHAFLFEAGLSDYSYDENLVEWIATKLPDIVEACEKTKAL